MPDYVYNRFKYNLLKKLIDCSADDIKAALMTSGHSANHANVDLNTWSQVSANEISGTGYTAGGKSLTGKAVTQDNTDDEGVFTANDVSWTSSTFTTHYAVLHDVTIGTDDLICSFDFAGAKSVTNGTFTMQWAAEGIININ